MWQRWRIPAAVLLVILAISASPVPSSASTDNDGSDLRIVSSFVAVGEPVPRACREEALIFARNLVRYPRPASWHWILLCDEAGWRRFLRTSGRDESEPIYASTDLALRTTCLRGAKLLYPYDLKAEPAAILMHELAHIQLNSPDEELATALAEQWRTGARRAKR